MYFGAVTFGQYDPGPFTSEAPVSPAAPAFSLVIERGSGGGLVSGVEIL